MQFKQLKRTFKLYFGYIVKADQLLVHLNQILNIVRIASGRGKLGNMSRTIEISRRNLVLDAVENMLSGGFLDISIRA